MIVFDRPPLAAPPELQALDPTSRRGLAARVLALVDLTSLNADDDDTTVRQLCDKARSGLGQVAAVCVWPRFVATARSALEGTNIPVAAVTNFPAGTGEIESVIRETAGAIDAGAREIDVVLPWRALLAGNDKAVMLLLTAVREACPDGILLKVILETGQLPDAQGITKAAQLATSAGADFLKTSTGKTHPGATPEAARLLVHWIAARTKAAPAPGLKVSGGVRTLDEALAYLAIFESQFGAGTATPANFRIGASSLMTELLAT